MVRIGDANACRVPPLTALHLAEELAYKLPIQFAVPYRGSGAGRAAVNP
jgi:hypothetical protein